MRSCLLLASLIFQLSYSNAQIVRGKITSATDQSPLTGVTVIANDTLGIISGNDGGYEIHLSPGTHSLIFRMLSFREERRTLTLGLNESIEVNIVMQEKLNELGTVVISAGKFEQKLEEVTVSMEVLKPELIESRNTTAMDEAVDNIAGVNIIDGQANIRGGSGWSYGAGSRVQVLVDDLPQLTADANDAKWNFYPVENLEQVEVIKGASSVLFGSSALNGVINIRTAYPRDTPLTKINFFSGLYDKAYITTDKKYSLSYQDDLSGYGGINFFHSRKFKRLDFVAGGNYFRDYGYRQGESENRLRVNFSTRYNFKTPGLSAGVNLNTMVNKATIFFLWKNDTSGAYIPAEATLSDSKTYRTTVDPFVTYITKGGSSHRLRTRWFNSTNKNNTDQNTTGNLYYLEYQYQKRLKNVIITGGVVDVINVVDGELYGNHKGYQRAIYFQEDANIDRLAFSFGARAEQNKLDDELDEWTPVFRSGINYRFFEATYIRASIGQGYRYPSIAEKYVATTVGGANIFPNENLLPEEGLSIEAGVRQIIQSGKVTSFIDLAFFQNKYYDMIEFVFAMWGNTNNFLADNGFRSVNVGDTRIRGLEAGFGCEISMTHGRKLIIQGGYTYLDPRQLTYDSAYVLKIGPDNVKGSDSTDFLKYRYRHLFRGDVEIVLNRLSFGTTIRYNSRMENIDKIFTNGLLDSFFPPGLGIADYRKYHTGGDLVLDFRASYDITKNLRLAVIVKNISNNIFMQRPADMQPPRTFAIQGGLRF